MAQAILTKKENCRVCKGRDLKKFLSLGSMPLANAFLSPKNLKHKEPAFPLEVYLCSRCSLAQLVDVVSPKVLFKDYVYVSSTSESFVAHFRSFAQEAWKRFDLRPGSLIVDVGSNDGILLKPFKELGANVLGVEPAANIAKIANNNGIDTIPAFFSKELAKRIAKTRGRAAVVTATNVFAHVDDLDGFVGSMQELLSEEGVFIFEVPYLGDMIRKNLFDTIYHEHLSYFSVKPLTFLFKRLGMEIVDIQTVASHGGSLRVFVKMLGGSRASRDSVESYLQKEKESKLHSFATMKDFARRIAKNKKGLLDMLRDLKSQGKKIAGYGAPAKGNTLLNYFGIDYRILEYIIDDSPWKQGLFTPGTHIPVAAPSRLGQDKPDYLLILAWNFAEPIMKKLASFQAEGGKFIIPVPEPQIVSSHA